MEMLPNFYRMPVSHLEKAGAVCVRLQAKQCPLARVHPVILPLIGGQAIISPMPFDKEEPLQIALELRPLIPFALSLPGQTIQVVDLGVQVVEKIQGKCFLHHGQGGGAELIPAVMA